MCMCIHVACTCVSYTMLSTIIVKKECVPLSRNIVQWSLHKKSISAASTWDSTLLVTTQNSWPEVGIETKPDIKMTAQRCLNDLRLLPWNNKAELCFFSPTHVSTSLFCFPSLVNTIRMYLYFRTCYCSVLPLTCSIHLIVFQDRWNTVPWPFSCWFSFQLTSAQKVITCMLKAMFRGFKYHQTVCKMQTVDPPASNSDIDVYSAMTVYPLHIDHNVDSTQPCLESNTHGKRLWFYAADMDKLLSRNTVIWRPETGRHQHRTPRPQKVLLWKSLNQCINDNIPTRYWLEVVKIVRFEFCTMEKFSNWN